MKLCIALLLLSAISAGQNPYSDLPIDNPFSSFSVAPVNEVKITGKVVATISNGDFVHPTFSPDGKILFDEALSQPRFRLSNAIRKQLARYPSGSVF